MGDMMGGAGAQASAREDAELLQSLIREFRPALVQYFARRIPETSEAEDLAQEVFARLIQRGNIRDIKMIRGYLFEAANNVLVDWLRRNRARGGGLHDQIDIDLPDDTGFEIERVLVAREELLRVTATLLELPERTRSIFVLRRFEGMKYKDIANRLGLSLSTVEKHMQQATMHLLGRSD